MARRARATTGGEPIPSRVTRRRFEQWARNPLCVANTLSAVHGIPMREVAKREGLDSTFGQSPFALARGQNFERMLFRSAGAPLREGLVPVTLLPRIIDGISRLKSQKIWRKDQPGSWLTRGAPRTVLESDVSDIGPELREVEAALEEQWG